jgi:membrane associated rhomboid family serine protease
MIGSVLEADLKLNLKIKMFLLRNGVRNSITKQILPFSKKRLLHVEKRSFSFRNYRNLLDQASELILKLCPGRSAIKGLIGLNCLFYILYLFAPKEQAYILSTNCVTQHFCHNSLFQLIIDSGILYLVGNQLEKMRGSRYVLQISALSLLLASLLLSQYHPNNPKMRQRPGNDTFIRGLIFNIIFTNPSAQFILFPLPIPIKAWAIGIIAIVFDFLSFNVSAYGGMLAGFLMSGI